VANELKHNTSVWLALKNRVFFRLWLASLISGVCVGAHSTVATWLMHMSTGPSTLLLSLLTTAASLPFFLFTFPAGALADLSNRRGSLHRDLHLVSVRRGIAGCFRLVTPSASVRHPGHGFFDGDRLCV
jgi:MFS family permease